jgi:uncharacterized protein YkwD
VRRSTLRRLRRIAPIGLAGLTLAGSALAAAPAVAATFSCPASDADATTMTLAAVVSSTRCLLNEVRAEQGLKALGSDQRLTGTARGHSRRMVAEQFFAHDTLSGRRFDERIAATGWMDGRPRWIVGENLAWGTGARSTPHATVDAWLASAPHRRNILTSRFRVVGIGVSRGTPYADAGPGITYTTDFGS